MARLVTFLPVRSAKRAHTIIPTLAAKYGSAEIQPTWRLVKSCCLEARRARHMAQDSRPHEIIIREIQILAPNR
jgi:hypothetical protein